MGGFPEADIETDIVQCPYCGEFVDGYRAIEKWEEREDEA